MTLNNAFNTTPFNVIIEDLTYTNSAFGQNEEGDVVFFNNRLVNKLNLDLGDIVVAHCIPNYEDKRHETPWRAIRVTSTMKDDGQFEDLNPYQE